MPDPEKKPVPIDNSKSIFDGAKSVEVRRTSYEPSVESTPLGLTAQGKPVDFGKSQYDVAETTPEAIESGEYKYYRGERQSAADKWANGIIRFVGKTPARLLEGVLNPFLGTAAAIGSQDFSKVWDNALTNGINDLGKALDEEFPLYQTRESEEATGFSKLAYANTWAGDILDGVSYSVAAMGSGNVHTKLLGALAKSSVLGKTTDFLGKLMSIENASDKIKYINQIDDVFKTQIKDGVKKGTFALMGATTEASDNALSDSKEWVAKMEEKLTTDEYGRKVRELTEGERAWLESNRKQLGNTSFAINLPVIMADNWFTFGKAMMGKGGEKLLMSEVADLIEETAEGGYKAAKKGFIQNALDKTYGLRTIGGRAIPEALQEQLQYGITKGTEDFYTKRYYNPKAADFIESMQVGLTNAFATQEGWDQALIGGIVGGLTGNVTTLATQGVKAYQSPTDQLVTDALEILNTTKSKDAYKAAMETINRHANLTEEQAMAAKANDDFEYQNKQSDLFLNYVLGRIKTGKTDDLVSDLNDFKSLSPEEFESTYDVKLGVNDVTGAKQTVADFVQKRLDKVNKIQKLYNSLENIVPNAPSNLKDRLLYSAFALEDAKDRASTLDTEVKDIVRQNLHTIFNPTEKAALLTDYTQLTEPAAKQAYKESVLNSTLSPLDQKIIIDKLNDFDKLKEREAQFVREYKELLNPNRQAEIMQQDAEAEDIVNNADEILQTGEVQQVEQPVDLTDLEKEFNTKSTEELTGMLDMLTDPNNALATDPDAAADIKANIEAISKVLEQRKQKTAKPTEQQPVDKKITPSGTVPQYTEEELADLIDEDLFVPEVPEVGELEEDEKTFTKVVELQKKLEAGEISQEDFNEGIANIGKAVKPREPVSPEQDIVSNSMVNEYIDTAELSDDNDINKQDIVQTSNADGKTLAKMSNISMMSLFKHKIELIGDGVIRLFRWVRGADGKVLATDTAISSTVNNPDVANKGSKIIYRVVELDKAAQETNNKNIDRSKKIISSALKAYPQLGYTEADAKFEGDVYTATIGMFTEDGTLVGYYQLPHALDITKTTSSEDMANYVKVRQQILAERKAILDKIANGEEASTEVLDKGYGNLLTQVVDNKPVMQGNLFTAVREEDKFNGQPVFIFEGAKGFEIKGYQELRDEYNSFVTSLPKFNKTGRVYQVIRAANGKYSIIPVYTNLIDDKVADKIIQTIQNLDDAPNYNDIISALNPYIYAGDSKKRPGVSMDVSGDGAKTKFTIGGEVYTLQEIQNNSSRLSDFKQALLKKRHNLEVNKLNDANYQKELANNNAISTNAYTSEGQYFVQPLIIVKPIVGETIKATPIKEKVTEVKPITTPTTDARADIERRRQEELNDEKQGLTKEAALKDANNTLKKLKDNPKVDASRIEGLSKFIKYLNESSSVEEAFDKHFESYKNKETNKVDEEVQLNFDSILAAKNQINAKYNAELAALEGAKLAEAPAAPVSDVEAKKADIEKEIKQVLRNITYTSGVKPYDNPDIQDELEIAQASRNIANALSKGQPLTFEFLKANLGGIFTTTNNNVIKISINKGTGNIELQEVGTVKTIIIDKNDNISYDFENKGKELNLKAARAISQAESKHQDKLKDIFKKYDAELDALEGKKEEAKPTPQAEQQPTTPVSDKKADIERRQRVTDIITSQLELGVELPKILETLAEQGYVEKINNSAFFKQAVDRDAIVFNIDGAIVPIYRSSQGTSSKTKGKWYPFFFNAGDWLVKAGADTYKEGYNNPIIKQILDTLNKNYTYDKPIATVKGDNQQLLSLLEMQDLDVSDKNNNGIYDYKNYAAIAIILKDWQSKLGNIDVTGYQEYLDRVSSSLIKANPTLKSNIQSAFNEVSKLFAELAALEGKEEVIPTAEPITNDDIIISTKDEVETDEDYKKAQDALKAKFAIDPNELLSDGDAFSRGSMAIDGKPVDPSLVKEAKDFISKYVPFLTLSDLNTVSQVKGAMIDSIGMLRGTTMYLFQGSTIKTAYHESFHGVFRNMLTKAEQQAVINEMRDKYGKPTQAELNYQIEAIPAYYKSVLSEEEINMFAENKHFEEKLADEFMEVADTEINKPWYKKIADFFKRIFNMFNIFSKTTMSESELLFRNILAKKYATGKPVVLNKDLSAYNEIPAFSRIEQDTKISPVTRGQRVNSIAAEFVKRYMNLVKSGKTITREDGPRIFNEIRNSYKQFFIAQFKEGFPNAQAAAVANYVKSNFDTFVSDAISVIRTTYKIKADKNGIIEMLKNQLDSEEQGEDVEYTEIEETGMTKEYGQDFINISGIKSASTRLKLALSFVPKRDADGVVEKDPYGFDKYYNHEQVYYWLERNLVGITDMNEMLDAIKSASVFKPELGDVYNMLTETKEGDNLKEHEMFKNEFRSNFAKQQMAYLLILFEKQGKNEAPKYKIIDSNRQSLAREIFDRWKNNVRDISGTIAETAPDGQVIIHGTKAAKELKAKYQSMIGTITPSQMREVLAKVGIIYSDGVVEKVFESNDKEAMIKSVIPVLDWYASDDPAMEETQGRINLGNLVKYELNGNLNSYTSSFNNVENRAIYTIQNPSYASKIISTIKGKKAKFDAFYNERMKDPFFKHSNLLEELTSNIFREERFKVYFLNGLKDGKGSGMGAKWTKMSAADKFSMVLELFSNKKETISQTKTEATAYYSNITESDKTLHSLIRSKKYVVKTMPMEVNGKTTRVINPNSEIVEKFYNVALNEAGRIKSALEFKEKLLSATGEERTALEGKLLEHYHFKKGNKLAFDGQAYKFMQIDGLNSLLEPITEAISNNSEQDISDILEPLKTEIKQAIADDLTRLYRQTLVEAVNAGAVKVENGLLKSVTLDVYDVNEEGNRKGLRPEEEQLKIQQLLASFSANEYLNNIEYSAIMNGDLAFYKPGDGPKRFYQANSMTRSWNTNTISKIKFAVVDDLETVTNPKTLEYLKDKLGDKAEKNWGEAAKAINVTDATVFISPELFLKIHEAQGTWTPAIQKAYDIAQGIIEPDNKDTSWHNQITVSKPFIYGQEFDPSIGAMRPVQIKCTFVPLMKTFTDSNPLLADMALRMKESKTDAVAMKSAMKASMNITDDLLTTKLGFNNSLEVSVDNAGIQVDNPDHLVDSVSSSNRQQKMLLPAMIDIGHTYNGRAGIDIRTEINEIEAINVSEDKTRLDKIFGTKEFNEDIAEALNSRNANNNQRQVLHVNDDGTFDYPLDMINSTSSENLISSIFTKRVVKQDFKGGSAVQVTGVGYKFKSDYKTVGDVQAIIDTNEELKKLQSDLEYIKASKDNPNQIDYVDVVMPAWDSRFFSIDKNGNTVLTDINSLPNNIKNFILQRIPNEGPHSNMVVRVKQFLPAEYGNMIILPYEVTKQLGSDFDFDKVFFHITEFFKDKDGSFKKVEFIDGTDDKAVDTRYNIYVNDAIRKNRNKLPVEAVVKSELNRLINTVKQKGIELGLKTNDRVYQLLDEIQELENKVRLNTATKKDKATLDNKLIEFASIELVRNSLEEKLDQAYQNKNTVDKMMLDKLIDMNLVVTKEDFAKRTIIGQNIKPARNNRLLDNYDTVLRDVHHLEDVTTPSGFENIEEVFNKVSGNSTLLNFYTGNTQRYLADLFHAIIGLKGQSATHVTGHAFGSMMRLSPKTKFYLVDKKGNSVEYNSLSNRTSKDGTLIIKDISSMMAAILDAVKKPDLLPGLGINSKSIDAWATIVRLGMGTEVASLFTASPAIKELTNALISNNNQIKSEDFKFKAAKDIIAKYKSELNEVIKYLPEDKLDTFDRSPINKAISDNKTYVSFKPTQMLADIQLANDPAKLNDAEVRAYYLANQVRLLQMYTHMEGTMNFLNDFNRFTAINKEVGPNIEDIIDKVYLEKKLVNSNAVEGFATESLPQLNSIFDAHRIALEKLNEHFPYASDQYSYIKSQVARMQYKDTGATEDILNIASEDRQKINGFIKAYIDGNAPVLSEVTTTEEKKRLFTKLPLKLSEIQKPSNDKKEGFFNGALRKSPLIENLKVERLTEGENLWYISVKGNRLTPDMQNLMADSFMALYNNKETKDFAIDLIKHSFASTGFYTGLNSFAHIIPPSILMDLGYVEYRRNEVNAVNNNKFVISIDDTNNLVDQLVRNFPKIFTDTYNDEMFIGFETESKPTYVEINEAKLKDSGRSNTLVVGEIEGEDGVSINKYQRYIRVYSNKYKGSLLYKNVSPDNIDTRYELINYLGQSGKLIEIDPKGKITESIIRTNNYKTPVVTTVTSEALPTATKPMNNPYAIIQDDINDSEDSNDEVDVPVETKQGLTISTPSTESTMTVDQLGLGDLTEDDFAEMMGDDQSEIEQIQDDADDLPDDIEPGDCKPTKK